MKMLDTSIQGRDRHAVLCSLLALRAFLSSPSGAGSFNSGISSQVFRVLSAHFVED